MLIFPWYHNEENPAFCPLDDFIEYAAANVILDYDYVDKFCRAEVGIDYINMARPKPKKTPKPDDLQGLEGVSPREHIESETKQVTQEDHER